MLSTGPFRIGQGVAPGAALNRAHPLNVGLVGRWMALPGRMAGPTCYDVAGSNNGTLTGGATWRATSRPGGVGELRLDGSTGYVNLGASPALNLHTAPATLVFSLRFAATPTADSWAVSRDSDTLGRAFAIGYDASNGASNVVFLQVNGVGQFPGVGSTAPVAGRWYRVALVATPSTWSLYLDGALGTSFSYVQPATTTGPTLLGRRSFSGFEGYLNGSIDDVALYNRALSPAEVAALYSLSLRGYPGLLNRSGVSSPALFGSSGGTTTPISSSDTGAAADAATLAAALSWPETGTATEGTPTLLAALATVADGGAAAEGTPTLLAGLAQAEGGSGSDSATLVASLSRPDTGTATEGSPTLFAQLATAADTGTATEGTPTLLAGLATVADAGTGTEGTPTLLVGLAQAEGGSGSDSATLVASLATADSGTGTDSGSIFVGLSISDSDAGTGTDGGTLAATLSTSDVASGVDLATLIASIATADSGTATDTGSVFAGLTVADSDSGHGTDGGSLAATVTTVESAAGLDLAAILATLATADSGTGTDAGSIFSGLTVADSDTGVGTEGAATLAAAVATADAAAGGESASTAAALAAADAGLGLDGQSLLASLARSDAGVGSDAGSVEDVTGSITIDVSAADAGAGLEATVALAAALADAESAAGSDGGWVLVGTVDAPYRDRQFLRMIADALAATGEFDEVRTTGLPEDVGRPASDLRLACLELAGWQDVDDWADVESTEQIRTVHYSLYLLVRLEDPDERDDELDRLVAVAANALNGIALGDVSVPNKTRLLKGTYQPAASIERRIKVDGQFVYTIPDFNRHSATDA